MSRPTMRRICAGEPVGGLTQVWLQRTLLLGLVRRNLTVKYQRSPLGFLWTVFSPALTVILLTTVFTHVVRIPIPHYWAFLLSGYFTWHFVQQSVFHASYVLSEDSNLMRSVAFPNEILVFSAALTKLLEFCGEIVLVGAVLVVFHHGSLPWSMLVLPVAIVIQFILTLGLMFLIAPLSVLCYDVKHTLPVALLTLFYLSPVFYPVAMVPESLQVWYRLNPLAGLLELYHRILYRGEFPGGSEIVGTIVAAFVLFVCGSLVFRKLKAICVEIC